MQEEIDALKAKNEELVKKQARKSGLLGEQNVITPQPVHKKLISHATNNSISAKLSNDLNLSQSNQSCEEFRHQKS